MDTHGGPLCHAPTKQRHAHEEFTGPYLLIILLCYAVVNMADILLLVQGLRMDWSLRDTVGCRDNDVGAIDGQSVQESPAYV